MHEFSRRPSNRAPVPLIISSFPAPPSHIPPTPQSSISNPPPTGPPLAPLPPLPSGPSRISGHDQLFLLSSIGNRGWKYPQRDSIINGAPPPPNRDSVVSSRSTSPFRHFTRSPSPISSTRISMDSSRSRPSRARHLPDQIDPELLLELQDSNHIQQHSPTSPSTPSSRRSPVTANYYSHMPLSESYRLAHARSTSTVTTVVPPPPAGSPQSQTQTPMQNHTRSLSNSSTSPTHLDGTTRGGLGLDLGLGLSASPTYISDGTLTTSPSSSPIIMTDSYSTTTQFSTISSESSHSQSPLPAASSSSQGHKAGSGEGEEGGRGGRETRGDKENKRDLDVTPHQHSLSLSGIVTTKAMTTTNSATNINNKTTPTEGQAHGRQSGEMTLDEFGILPAQDYYKKQNYPDHQDLKTSTQSPRVPSPDIATILSVMSRPALSLSRADTKARSKHRSKSTAPPGKRRVVSVSTTNTPVDPKYHPPPINRNRRQSEGASTLKPTTTIPAHGKNPSSELAYLHKHSESTVGTNAANTRKMSLSQSMSAAPTTEFSYSEQEADDYDEALERVLEGRGSEDEEDAAAGVAWESAARDKRRGRRAEDEGEGGGGGDDSDSSLDLHTPLPHLMLRHGLLSPNSKLLPQAGCSRAATPLDGRPGSMMSLVSNGSVMTKSGVIKDERDTLTRRVRHRDGKLLRGGIGLTTGLGWSDSEDEDAPSPLTRRLSTLNLSRRSSASSIRSTNLPPFPSPSLSTSVSSSSLRRLHPLSRSYSSGAILETDRVESYDDSYSYTYDDEEEEEEEEEDRTLEESGHWAQRHRLGVSISKTSSSSSPPVSWQRHQPPPTSRSRNRRSHQTNPQQSTLGARTSTSSVGSTFSLEVTIPESGDHERERSKTPSRLRRPSSHTSIKSTAIGGAGGRDSSGSSSFDNRSSGLSSNISLYQRRSAGDDNLYTPSSTTSTPSISMPATPKDIFDPSAPPLFSSTRGMLLLVNKDKSLPPLPAGGLKKKPSGCLQQRSFTSNGMNSGTTATAATATATTAPVAMNGTGKYAFPSTRARALSSTSTPPPSNSNMSPSITPAATAIGSPSIIPASSSAATIKPQVRPFQLPRHSTSRTIGDRPAVPVPPPSIPNSAPLLPPPPTATTTTPDTNTLRAPITSSFSTTKRPSPITPILLGHAGTTSAPCTPTARPLSNPNLDSSITTTSTTTTTAMTTGIVRPKPRTGTGMVYRTSSYGAGVNSKMRAPMMLSGSSSVVSSVSVSGGGGGGVGNGSNGVPRAIAL